MQQVRRPPQQRFWSNTFTRFVRATCDAQILGPVTVAKLYAVTSHLDFLTLSGLIEKALSCPPPAPPEQHALQLQQQLPGQLRAEGQGQPHQAGCVNDLPDIGSLSPTRSSDLFGSLDFLQDPMLSSGMLSLVTHPRPILAKTGFMMP